MSWRKSPQEFPFPFLEVVFTDLADGIIVTDVGGKFLRFNPSAEKIMGMGQIDAPMNDRPKIYGLFLPDKKTLFKPQDLPLARAIRGESVNEVEIFLCNEQRPEGVFLSVNARPLKDEKGSIVGGVAVFRDITQHKTNEEKIRHLTDFLERRVAERTQELIHANERLTLEIGERQKAEEVLRREKSRLRLVTEQMPAILYTMDEDLKITSSMGKGLTGLGLLPNQLVGVDLYQYLNTSDRNHLPIAAHLKALQGESSTYEYLWSGNVYHTHVEPLKDADGKILGVIGLALDVTQMKKTEEDLGQTISLLRATLESTADGILVVNQDGKMMRFNRKFLEMWGIPPELADLKDDKKAIDYVLDQLIDPKNFIQKVQELYACPEASSFDILKFKDGKVFERFSQPQRLGENIVGRVWSFRDVSDRVKAESELHRRTQQTLAYQAGLLQIGKMNFSDLDSALEKFTEVDAVTINVERVSVWFYNRERSEIICRDLYLKSEGRHEQGLKLEAIHFPKYFHALEESRLIAAEDAQNDPYTREFTEAYLKPLGISSMLDVPIRLQGKVIGIVCHEHVGEKREWSLEDQDFASSIADLVSLAMEADERKKAELALQKKSEDLARSNTELEQFAYVASHDLQEPLHLVIAFGDRLKSLYGDNLGEKGLDYLRRMQKSANRMRLLIDDLLQYARVTTRAKPFETVPLQALVQEVLGDLELRSTEAGAKIEVGDLPEVLADRLQMRQLFQNLIANALKFRRSGVVPEVRISSRTLEEKLCEISVEDNGIGFEEKYGDKIFRPFHRLFSHSQYDGSGMGLAICEKIVARHGGKIAAHGKLGEGAKFYFSLKLP